MDIAEHSSTEKKKLKNVSSYRDMAVDVSDSTYFNHKYNHTVNTILPSSTRHSGGSYNQCPTFLVREAFIYGENPPNSKIKSSVPSQRVSVLVPISLNHEQRTVPILSKEKKKPKKTQQPKNINPIHLKYGFMEPF